MAEVVSELYEAVRPTTFEIVHEQNRLKSEYVCYADFECESWLCLESSPVNVVKQHHIQKKNPHSVSDFGSGDLASPLPPEKMQTATWYSLRQNW
jgi:hypothetical protein